MTKTERDYRRVAAAAVLLGKSRIQVYEYLRRPEVETGILRMKVGRSTFVDMKSLRDYEATLTPGRPRKDREKPQHDITDVPAP